MNDVRCDACGQMLVATAAYAGLTVTCASCGARTMVPGVVGPVAEESPERVSAAPLEDPLDPAPAYVGEVPAPRATGADADGTRVLGLAAVSLILPLIGPFALWYAISAGNRVRQRGGEEPTTIRHARFIATVGTVLLGILVVCSIPFLLVLG